MCGCAVNLMGNHQRQSSNVKAKTQSKVGHVLDAVVGEQMEGPISIDCTVRKKEPAGDLVSPFWLLDCKIIEIESVSIPLAERKRKNRRCANGIPFT